MRPTMSCGATRSARATRSADGSGPTPGVPNGVVDQFDYAFWRANFGSIGVPSSGSGSGAGAGEVAAATNVSVPLLAAPSTSPPDKSNDASTVNTAVIDQGEIPIRVKRTFQAATHVPPSESLTAAQSTSLLLLLNRGSSTTPLSDDTLDVLAESSVEHYDEVDQLFASFDEGDLVAGVGQL